MTDVKKEKCVICGKEVQDKYAPFCSQRCAQVDLGKWLNESYAVSLKEGEEEIGP